MKAHEINFTVEKKRARWEDTAGCTWKERVKCAEFCSSLPLLFRHNEQDIFSICSFLFMEITLPLWHWALLLGTLPLMLNHVDIKVFLWLTRHDMSGNIQPGSKMELVKGLHTTTNSQAEQGMRRRRNMFSYSDFNRGTKTILCGVLGEASSVVSVYCTESVFIIDDDF